MQKTVYITGDTHRDFSRIFEFASEMGTTTDDILIILGDAGINYYIDNRDNILKQRLSKLPLTLFCVKGNHELHADEICSYEEIPFNGAAAYVEPEYPNLIFAKDGEIYDFNGSKAIVIGGAYSIDKHSRIAFRAPWFDTEQPSEAVKEYVEHQLEKAGWQVDYVFSHTAPRTYEPTHVFIPGLDQSCIDKSTEDWLDDIEKRLSYGAWFCGHYHCDDCVGGVRIMFEDIEELDV